MRLKIGMTVFLSAKWRAEEADGDIVLTLEIRSSIWQAKTCRVVCQPDRFRYELEVEGCGSLAEVDYFGGYCSAFPRWGSGRFWSGQYFKQGFNPEPNAQEINLFQPSEGTAIDLMGVPLPGRADWFFTPPPFCFAFEYNAGWLGIGVEAASGENRFTEYSYSARKGGFYLSLSYEGHTQVQGRYQLPSIGFDFALNQYEALGAHVRGLREAGYVQAVQSKINPLWWYEPIFCGWGAQCSVASAEGGRAPDYARQDLYETFLATLDQSGIRPGVVVLDDKWQTAYGTNQVDEQKWPDIRGFINQQHARGTHVLLWLKAWDPEGLPLDECIQNAGGLPVALDPSNPTFEERLRESVRWMLSPQGYGADGFKIDFTARIPSGPGMRLHGDTWGLELMKRYLAILHSEAKQVKRDALIMTHTPHPYLADVVDMIRLNDINTGKDVNQAMTLRARIAGIACPEAVIDTDNWPITNRADWRKYLAIQADLGVPSLYYSSCFDSSSERMDAEDYQLIREVWNRHRARI